MQHVFKNFWGSHVMNIAAFDGVYCPCPTATLSGRMFCFPPESKKEHYAFDKYLDRDFSRVSAKEYEDSDEFSGDRSLADELTKFFPYQQGAERESSLGDRFELTPSGRAAVSGF